MSVFDVENWSKNDFVTKVLQEAQDAKKTPLIPAGKKIVSAELQSLSGAGGNSGEMNRLVLNVVASGGDDKDGADTVTAVLKTTKTTGGGMSKALGLYREAIFYDGEFKSRLEQVAPSALPLIYLSKWDEETGNKCILMEDLIGGHNASLCAVQSGYFFGDNSILNKGKDLADITKEYKEMGTSELDITKKSFEIAAQLHGTFWGEQGLLQEEHKFLKGQLWFQNQDQAGWETSVNYAKGCWEKCKKTKLQPTKDEKTGEVTTPAELNFGPRVTKYLDDSFSCTFADYQKGIQHIPFTLVHGDFHPANFMAIKNSAAKAADDIELKALDFEVIGLGSGPQDLGQYMLSHSFPKVRKEHEDIILEHYHKELARVMKETGKKEDQIPSLEDVKYEYVLGGLGRWVWLLAVISDLCPVPMTQFFHEQIDTFLADHEAIHKNECIVPRP